MPGHVLSLEDKQYIHEKYICPQCREVLRDPVQTIQCGHRYCETCLEEIMGQQDPVCQEDGTELKPGQFFQDKCVQREILGMIVSCIFMMAGCCWKGELKDMEDHSKVCEHAPMKCIHSECGKEMKRSELAQHLETQCVCGGVLCDYCQQTVKGNQMEMHYNTCPKYPVTCSQCYQNGIPRSEFPRHQEMICEGTVSECSFLQFGCQEKKKMTRSEKKEHEKENVGIHLNFLLAFILKIQGEIMSLINELTCVGNVKQLTQDLINKLFSQDDKLTQEMHSINQTLSANTKKIIALENASKHTSYPPDEAFGVSFPPNGRKNGKLLADFFKEFKSTQERLGGQDVFNTEVRLDAEDLRKEQYTLKQEVEKQKRTIKRLEGLIDSQDHLLNIRNITIAELNEKIHELEIASYGGELLWKIANVTRKKHEAVTGKRTSFYSQPFYTSHHGYKMCARIYLNGDGMGKATHISIFFVLMRGEYDAVLTWPFQQKVIIMMLDQNGKNHTVDSFFPDPTSSSFKRPTTDMNIATGCPMFLPLGDLDKHAYVRDDTMFVKIIVVE